MNKCVFLDRDGVLNCEIGDYAFRPDHFVVVDGVGEALKALKAKGYLLIVATNQAGISKGLYTDEDVMVCHGILQEACGGLIDDIYYCPYHPSISESLCRKPDSLMFEKAIAKYRIDPRLSWMIGDAERDMIPARKLGLRTVQVGTEQFETADYIAADIREAAQIILREG
mgnify:CR=1 FL=1